MIVIVEEYETNLMSQFSKLQAEACHTDTTQTSHTETPTQIETRTHDQCGDTTKSRQLLMMDVLMSETC